MTSPLTVLIVDDEPLARRGLRRLVERLDGYEVIGECGDGAAALDAIHNQQPAIMLLDIEMPGLSAFDVLRRSDEAHGPAIVLVTAFADHGLDAFDAGAVDYVLKPVDPSRLEQALSRAARSLRSGSSSASPSPFPARIVARLGGQDRIVPVADIHWIEAAGTYVRLHLDSEAVLHRTSLSHLAEHLDPARFVRIHRSAIVALAQVRRVTPAGHGDAAATLRSGHVLPVSRRHRPLLAAALAEAT